MSLAHFFFIIFFWQMEGASDCDSSHIASHTLLSYCATIMVQQYRGNTTKTAVGA